LAELTLSVLATPEALPLLRRLLLAASLPALKDLMIVFKTMPLPVAHSEYYPFLSTVDVPSSLVPTINPSISAALASCRLLFLDQLKRVYQSETLLNSLGFYTGYRDVLHIEPHDIQML
jgi:hypothetical protein